MRAHMRSCAAGTHLRGHTRRFGGFRAGNWHVREEEGVGGACDLIEDRSLIATKWRGGGMRFISGTAILIVELDLQMKMLSMFVIL